MTSGSAPPDASRTTPAIACANAAQGTPAANARRNANVRQVRTSNSPRLNSSVEPTTSRSSRRKDGVRTVSSLRSQRGLRTDAMVNATAGRERAVQGWQDDGVILRHVYAAPPVAYRGT